MYSWLVPPSTHRILINIYVIEHSHRYKKPIYHIRTDTNKYNMNWKSVHRYIYIYSQSNACHDGHIGAKIKQSRYRPSSLVNKQTNKKSKIRSKSSASWPNTHSLWTASPADLTYHNNTFFHTKHFVHLPLNSIRLIPCIPLDNFFYNGRVILLR